MRLLLIPAFALFFLSLAAQSGDDYAAQIAEFREHYKEEFKADPRAPLKTDEELAAMRFYPSDPSYRVEAVFVATPEAKPFEMATYSGITKPYRKYGVLLFELNGKKLKLAVYESLRLKNMPQFKDHLFLPFKDATNGEETYGGGRYIDLSSADIVDGKLVLDFNKAYNPWCCYSDGYSCPIPPTENHLDVPIRAGEMMYAGEHKH
ncbi:MAG: DUF1684 domain-containing protein [Saprospiraceae bacterium]